MSREEAREMLVEYVQACYAASGVVNPEKAAAAKAKRNAIRERLIDRLCGEEVTEPMAGRAP